MRPEEKQRKFPKPQGETVKQQQQKKLRNPRHTLAFWKEKNISGCQRKQKPTTMKSDTGASCCSVRFFSLRI
jgi:hypothetical protein